MKIMSLSCYQIRGENILQNLEVSKNNILPVSNIILIPFEIIHHLCQFSILSCIFLAIFSKKIHFNLELCRGKARRQQKHYVGMYLLVKEPVSSVLNRQLC